MIKVDGIDEEIVQAMVAKYNLDVGAIARAVIDGVYDDIAAIYHLMFADKKKKGVLETSPSSQVPMQFQEPPRSASAPPELPQTEMPKLTMKPLERIEEEPQEQVKTRPRAATVSSPEDKNIKLVAEQMTVHLPKANALLNSFESEEHQVERKEGRRRHNTFSGHALPSPISEESSSTAIHEPTQPLELVTQKVPTAYPPTPERPMRFMFTATNTTTQPPAAILFQIIQALPKLDIEFTYDGNYLFSCHKNDLSFDVEICKVPILKNVVRIY